MRMASLSQDLLNSEQMSRLLTAVEEATRATEEGVKYFVEPAEDSLRRAVSKRHHVVFGRRGSGKSSLLRKAAADLTVDRRPIAWVDLESFKGHSYPDLLISVLIKTLGEFKHWLETAAIEPANKKSFWQRLFGSKPSRPPFDRDECRKVVEKISGHLDALNGQLHAADEIDVAYAAERATSSNNSTASAAGAAVKAPMGNATGQLTSENSRADSARTTTTETYRKNKVEFLRRNVMEYQTIFNTMAKISGGDSYLFLDDLYHLRRPEQPMVLDYFHSVAKGNHLWLKIGTIRHRSRWYVHGSPPQGMKLGDDADEIDLDLTLEKYSTTKTFLSKILRNLADSVSFSSNDDFLTDTGLDRLVLASGGVARDFLAIFRRAVTAARERGSNSSRGGKVGAEDVNVAAGEHDTPKRDEFRRDIRADEQALLDTVFEEVRAFCLDTVNSNCFLVAKERRDATVEAVHELVDLKLLHLIRSRVTVSGRPGKIYEAYMLDVSQYAGARKRRGLNLVEFWQSDTTDQLRKASLILYEKTI